MDLSTRLRNAMETSPDAIAMEYRRREFAMSEVSAFGDRVISLLEQAGAPADAKIGIVQRNRPLHAAAILGILTRGRSFTSIYSMQSVESLAEELRQSRFAAVIADADDWKDPVIDAARSVGTACIRLDNSAFAIETIPGAEKCGDGPFDLFTGEPGLEILSSGTTGKPKRILFPTRILNRLVESTQASGARADGEADILTWPFGGIGGMCVLIGDTVMGRRIVVLERFNVPELAEATRRLKPQSLSGPPAVARMILDAKVPKEDLASVKYFHGGSAPMTPELQDAMESTYGIRVIWAYGATEFCGTVISWNPALADEFGKTKKGAIGRALPGIEIRVVDTETGAPLPPNEIGYLEAIVPDLGPDWIRTTDLALIDDDGFVFHKGRGDGAIVRGGFKILPEKVIQSLMEHPSVLDAACVGVPDERVGELPVAAVELRNGAPPVDEEALKTFLKGRVIAPQVPARILVMDRLPRTSSLKTDLGALKRMFAETASQA